MVLDKYIFILSIDNKSLNTLGIEKFNCKINIFPQNTL
jgi:hypothetical protein